MPSPDLKGVKTLLVDDDSTIRALLRRILVSWGADVEETDDGAKAMVEMKRAREAGESYDLILLDAKMPVMNGFEVAQHLKEYPELGRSILMLPPEARRSDVTRARDSGAPTHVVKPVTRPALLGAIATVLGADAERDLEPAAANDGDGSPLRVLVAEDNKDNCQLIEYYLDSPEFKIDIAENGGIAVDLYRMMEYDLVLMDVMMPVLDGYMATDAIRSWEKKNNMRRVPIIAMTAYARTEDARKSLRAGCDAYLVKPFTRDVLLGTIRKHAPRPKNAARE